LLKTLIGSYRLEQQDRGCRSHLLVGCRREQPDRGRGASGWHRATGEFCV